MKNCRLGIHEIDSQHRLLFAIANECDDTLERTTNGKGFVRNQPFDKLRKLDAGSWFSPEFKGEILPSLDEVLTFCAGKILVNVKIKPEAHEEPMPEDGIEIQVLDKVRGWGFYR